MSWAIFPYDITRASHENNLSGLWAGWEMRFELFGENEIIPLEQNSMHVLHVQREALWPPFCCRAWPAAGESDLSRQVVLSRRQRCGNCKLWRKSAEHVFDVQIRTRQKSPITHWQLELKEKLRGWKSRGHARSVSICAVRRCAINICTTFRLLFPKHSMPFRSSPRSLLSWNKYFHTVRLNQELRPQ